MTKPYIKIIIRNYSKGYEQHYISEVHLVFTDGSSRQINRTTNDDQDHRGKWGFAPQFSARLARKESKLLGWSTENIRVYFAKTRTSDPSIYYKLLKNIPELKERK